MFHRLQDWTRTLAEAALPQAAIILVAIPPGFSSFRWWILGPDLGPNKFSSHLGGPFSLRNNNADGWCRKAEAYGGTTMLYDESKPWSR